MLPNFFKNRKTYFYAAMLFMLLAGFCVYMNYHLYKQSINKYIPEDATYFNLTALGFHVFIIAMYISFLVSFWLMALDVYYNIGMTRWKRWLLLFICAIGLAALGYQLGSSMLGMYHFVKDFTG